MVLFLTDSNKFFVYLVKLFPYLPSIFFFLVLFFFSPFLSYFSLHDTHSKICFVWFEFITISIRFQQYSIRKVFTINCKQSFKTKKEMKRKNFLPSQCISISLIVKKDILYCNCSFFLMLISIFLQYYSLELQVCLQCFSSFSLIRYRFPKYCLVFMWYMVTEIKFGKGVFLALRRFRFSLLWRYIIVVSLISIVFVIVKLQTVPIQHPWNSSL